ncbi:MAG: L-aspartate oxidase [Candidatus Thorarchaeota archaeon]|nr:L-aspartate oxidase [Candidatus Thorarchaeota archaeon]
MIDGIEESDFLVFGSGIAGLTFALKAAEFGSVNIVTKRNLTDSATRLAQGGIAAVVSEDDSFDAHIEDTMRVGCGLCHRNVVEQIVTEAPDRIKDLVDLGVEFCTSDGSVYDLGLEGGHSHRRVLHVKDHTGRNIEEALAQAVRENGNIHIFENHLAVNLVAKNNEVLGAYVLVRDSGEVKRFAARAIVLATGGVGKVFLYTSNPKNATGDGIAMAYRVGATIANMEFIQFHPTLLYHHKLHSFLISEALRGEGAILIGKDGERFMPQYHPKAELAPRDIVARAIDAELKRTGADSVYLDISFKDPEWVKDRFPAIYETCKNVGIDITKEPIPVVPGAHYCCGGIYTDINGHTDVKGLFAIGETACTGFHGANRLASNSLLEGVVVGHNAAIAAIERLKSPIRSNEISPWDPGAATDPDELVIISHTWDEIRRIMTNYVGIVRSRKRLIRARNRIDFIRREIEQFYWDFKITPDLVELRNIATVAELIVRHARMRRESRGAHYNQDYPSEADQLVDTLIKKGYNSI